MKARDVMTLAVVSVSPETPTSAIARILRDHAISALPVVDEAGAPIGMVSEGDLIGRDEAARRARLDWWLTLLADGATLSEDFLASLRTSERRAGDIMSTPVITVGEDTDIAEIARLLTAHHIKRVPVLHDNRIAGIVSRADLVRALSVGPTEGAEPNGGHRSGLLAGAVAELDRRFRHHQSTAEQGRPVDAPAQPNDAGLMAADFRRLVSDHEQQEAKHRQQERRAAAEERRHRVAELVDHHITEESWRGLMHQARLAAERGEKEFMLLRFPSQLCSDGGRAVNAREPHWPATLRGEAAEIYLCWERDLKPHGFRLSASVLDFPGGMPGDLGLFLTWGE
jgi:CBS domain-containing protein